VVVFFFGGSSAISKRSKPHATVEWSHMNRAAQQRWVGRFAWAMVVLSAIALVLIISTAITLGAGYGSAGHGFDQVTLALPVFFVFWFMAESLGDWLDKEEFSFEPKPRLSTAFTRGPPA
jgi:hypothetical protein